MKKLLGILICLLLICVAIIPTITVAETYKTNIIHFMNPTALAVEGNNLYVADNIQSGKGVIHWFDISTNDPQSIKTLPLPTEITNISAADGVLYAMSGSKVYEINPETEESNPLQLENIGKVIDLTVFKGSLILFAETGLYINESGYADSETKCSISCVVSGDFLYYLYGENSNNVKRRIKNDGGIVGETDGVFNNHMQWVDGFEAIGMFAWGNGGVAIFGEHAIYTAVNATTQYNLVKLETFDDFVIKDADISSDKLCVLTRNNQLKIFSKNDTTLTDTGITIGSDKLEQDVPIEYTTFTLVRVRPNGYPANIVFKTTGDYSIDEIVTNASEYIIIGYDGDENSNYYYVLLGDRFGWVKKNDNADLIEDDDRLEIVNTDAGDEEHTYKVVSLNAMYVSRLPRKFFYDSKVYCKSYERKKIKNIAVKQMIAENETMWYYITFEYDGATHSGFVRDRDVKLTISSNTQGAEHNIIGPRKTNSLLFDTVNVYINGNPATMTEDNYAYDSDGKQIKLSSGTRVLLISENNGVAYIQIVKTGQYGYVFTDRLIGEHQITTNAAVGITLLAVAIALGITLTVVFVRRKRRKQGSAPTTAEN